MCAALLGAGLSRMPKKLRPPVTDDEARDAVGRVGVTGTVLRVEPLVEMGVSGENNLRLQSWPCSVM
jgi:hypothetical protein